MKKIFALIVLGLVTIGVVAWLANYLSTGTITITTNDKNNTITLQKTSGGKPFTKIATGSLSAILKHGQYTATVKNGLKTTIQTINFNNGHKTFHYSLSLANLLKVEPVAYENALDLYATPSQLVYLDGSSGTVNKIDGQNNLREVNNQQFRTVSWANPSFGVGQTSDGHLYTIAGGSVSPLKVPFSYNGAAVNFAVSPNKRIYVSYGSDVYAGSQTGGLKKIYTASSSNPALAAGVNEIAVSDSKYGGKASDISKPLLAVISTSGKETKKNVEAERVTWSPNGKYLAVVNQASPTIYDVALHQVTVVPTSSVVGQLEWLNNTTLFYASSYQLWTYDLPDQKTQLLTDVPPTDSITGIYVNSDGSYVYITTLGSFSTNYAVKRVGLKSQPVPDYVYQLQSILPINSGSVILSLINFSGPPKILVGVVPSANPTPPLQQATQELQGLGFDTNKVRFDVESIEP